MGALRVKKEAYGLEAGAVSNGSPEARNEPRGFLARLSGDTRANTLAMMAAALVPVAGLTGSAIDAARMYVVKVRLQQACDAGALAGRKFMVVDANTTLDSNATQQAQTFFNNNFPANFYDASNVTFTPSRTANNQVAGTASATVPMAVMGMFGFQPVTMSVACQARDDIRRHRHHLRARHHRLDGLLAERQHIRLCNRYVGNKVDQRPDRSTRGHD